MRALNSNRNVIQDGHVTLLDGDSTCFWVFYYERHVNADTSDPFEWILCQFLSSLIETDFHCSMYLFPYVGS